MLPVVVLLWIAASCRGNAADATVIVLDSSSARDSLEVVALPVDPASLHSPQERSDPPRSRATAADSLAAVDARFQQERAALDAEAVALRSGDRRSREYSRRFDAWHRRAVAADSMRALRDRLRARSLRVQLPAAEGKSTLRAMMLKATAPDGRAPIVRALARGDSVSVDLTHGEWWVGVANTDDVPSSWQRATERRLVLHP